MASPGSGSKTFDSPPSSKGAIPTPTGMSCEVKEYEARYNSEGSRVVKEYTPRGPDIDETDKGKFALRFFKYYNRENILEKVTLEIPSPHIRRALLEVVGSWPDQKLTGNVTLSSGSARDTLSCLYHHRRELSEYAEQLEDETAKEHVQLAVRFVDHELKRNIQRLRENLEAPEGPSVEFDDVWMLMRPGDLVTGGNGPERYLNKIIKVTYNSGNLTCYPVWMITAKSFVHDGTSYGYIYRQLTIPIFGSVVEISKLPVSPLKYHRDPQPFLDYLLARGQKYCDHIGIQYRGYHGEVTMVDRERTISAAGKIRDAFPREVTKLQGRIILDTKAFAEERNDADIKVQEQRDTVTNPITAEEYQITHFATTGFSLSEKRWAWFHIDSVVPVSFDSGAFDALLLPQKQKRLIRALTAKTTSSGDGFDDLIQGKGKGCIFLLHGEPGVGKTFTAEGIADDIQRPLYVMMSGELGSDVKTVDENLRRVLRLVTSWKAVLLIDEADVFLERRSSRDLVRNSLVSIFLRVLEYFAGVLFLTTNRISSFDPAFQSRIHLALRYNGLDTTSRAQLWRLFLQRTPDFDASAFPDSALQELAKANVNGRQIKNTVRTAYALALAEEERFGVEQVRDVLETVRDFKADFEEGRRRRKDGDSGVEGFGTPDDSADGEVGEVELTDDEEDDVVCLKFD
ncbi:putative AAA+ ATPase domain-containing protein [Seiridium unicorne]|uniref:AAA+ ATPase domain-containing protein n=1 Tax=Seiridium unicorne TaxID=138068 RepID=A0ABR2V0A2_9PEZI